MRYVIPAVALLLICSFAHADIIQFGAAGTFNAANCVDICAEDIFVSARYDSTILSGMPPSGSKVLPESLMFSSSGFLGTFTPTETIASDFTMRFLNSGGDEIDLLLPNPNFGGLFLLYRCASTSCIAAYGPDVLPFPMIRATTSSSVVAVLEPTTLAYLSVTALPFLWLLRKR
jgi:hypothetical protein